jgi:broad specificity phosphatase PhoE
MAGPLSSEGESMTEEYFADAYKGITFDEAAGGADIEYSPVSRTQKTAEIYSNVVIKYGIGTVKSSRADERLSEGSVAEHPNLIENFGGREGRWLKGWMEAKDRPLPDVKTGSEAAADFSEWLLAKVSTRQREGRKQEIDAFSHGPVMAAFLLKLEEKLGQEILPKNWQDKNIFESSLNYLNYMNFHADSSRPDTLSLFFGEKKIEIPISSLQELVRENQFMADVLQDVSNETIRESPLIKIELLYMMNIRLGKGFDFHSIILMIVFYGKQVKKENLYNRAEYKKVPPRKGFISGRSI